MREYHKIFKYRDGSARFIPYDNSIGEIMLYDGSFRLALSKEIWDKMETVVIDLLKKKLDDDWNKRHQFDSHVLDFQNHTTIAGESSDE